MKVAIFDVDGTLVDTVGFHAEAWHEALHQFGHPVDLEDVRSQIGKGGDQLMPTFLSPEVIHAQGNKIEALRHYIFTTQYLPKVRPLSRVRDLFEKLKSDGWKIALGSSGKKEDLKVYKQLCDIVDFADLETTSEDANASKPQPDIFLAVLARFCVTSSENRIVVGDAPYDVLAANKAGVRTIAFLSGGFSTEILCEAGALAVYRDPAHLLEQYETSIFARSR